MEFGTLDTYILYVRIQSSHWKAKKKCQKGETVDDLLIFVSSQKMEREAKRVKKSSNYWLSSNFPALLVVVVTFQHHRPADTFREI